MKIKPGANIQGIDIRMRPALISAESIWKNIKGFEASGITITCGLDGEHSAGSLHYYGRAVDIRIWYIENGHRVYISPDVLKSMCDRLRQRIGADFDIIIHKGSHVHVEFDPD